MVAVPAVVTTMTALPDSVRDPAVTGGAIQLTGQAIVGVSTAGTITINVVSAVACTVKELTPQGDYGNASGYVAQRIA